MATIVLAELSLELQVVAQYQFDDFNLPLRPSVAYLQSKGKDLYAYSRYGDKDLVKYVDVGAILLPANMSHLCGL